MISHSWRGLRVLSFSSPFRRSFYLDASGEQELFAVTTHRWLYNDERQRAIRYVPFNVQAFVDVAVRAASATKCTSFDKVQDGTFNRVFSLKFDNDTELIAKIPFPVAGPRHLLTASEVATLDYLRTEHGMPVPHVRAWCSRAETTPVGVEYIMYDKISGVRLHEHDKTQLSLEHDPYVDVLPFIQLIESRLAETRFSHVGSIYYKEDVPKSLGDSPLHHSSTGQSANSERFRIGPTVDREFWRAGRAALDIDRGPWPDVHSYMRAFAACARAAIDVNPDPSTHATYHRLISDYEKLVPHLTPPHVPYTLWHPNLHASNILVSESTQSCELKGVIDWQGALVAPDFMQFDVPPAYTAQGHPLVKLSDENLPELAAEVGTLNEKEKQSVQLAHRRIWRQRLHEIIMHRNDPWLAEDLYGLKGVQAKRLVTQPALAISRGMTEGIPIVLHSFLTTRSLWNLVVGVDEDGAPLTPFPFYISDSDKERNEQEMEQLGQNTTMCDELLESLGIPSDSDGIVEVAEYEAAKRAIEEAKQVALDSALSQKERDHLADAWPLQDGKLSLTAELCQ